MYFWAVWRDLQEATYWNSRYETVHDGGQVYTGTFCAPALAGDKTAYALLSGAGGVMVFRVGCDKLMDDPNSVACGIENALHRYVENWYVYKTIKAPHRFQSLETAGVCV